MKKLFSILLVLMSSIVCFAQNEDEIKPVKFASWTISDAFQAEEGFIGSYWKPTFNIAVDKDGFYCIVNLYKSNGYCSINDLPHLYLKTEDGKIIDLEIDEDEPIHKFYLAGYYAGRIWMPGRYVTRFIYYIPDIIQFLSNHYIKYRVWYGEGYRDVELSKKYSKKFNNRLEAAKNQVVLRYKEKEYVLNNPLQGF